MTAVYMPNYILRSICERTVGPAVNEVYDIPGGSASKAVESLVGVYGEAGVGVLVGGQQAARDEQVALGMQFEVESLRGGHEVVACLDSLDYAIARMGDGVLPFCRLMEPLRYGLAGVPPGTARL